MNGVLETNEYIACLNDAEINMTKQEIIQLSFSADLNGDGQIDYEEFMKHINDLVKLIRFHKKVQESYNAMKEMNKPGSSAATTAVKK